MKQVVSILKTIRSCNLPYIRVVGNLLWWERTFRLEIWRWFVAFFYYTPMFKSRCHKVGKNLRLIEGMPHINDNIRLVIGNNVSLYGSAGFGGYRLNFYPLLEIGDNTFIGPDVRIGVGERISIGKFCLIAARVFIADHDGHPTNWQERRDGQKVKAEFIKPIEIQDDVWIGEGSYIGKGVTIGRGAIIGARSVVTKSIPSNVIAAGNPAVVIREIC